MDTFVYSATPLQTFTGELFMIVFVTLAGLISMIYPFFTRKDKIGKRIITVILGIILVLAGAGTALAVYNMYQSGEATVNVKVEDKREVTRKCGSNSWRRCTSYVVEATDGTVYYDFTMDEEVWSKITPGACYAVTYYPPKPLFEEYLPKGEYDHLYQQGSDFTLIERIVCH